MILSCNTTTNNKIISVSENKRTFRIKNNSIFTINEVKIDGCYKETGAKCDFLFEIIEKTDVSIVFYVELKGSDISHAIEQLEATIEYCISEHKDVDKKKCYIVASKFPSSGTKSGILKKKFLKKNKIQLFIGTKQTEVTV
jgi:hypothetical protein